jgi:parallel beta-helix repeat protein
MDSVFKWMLPDRQGIDDCIASAQSTRRVFLAGIGAAVGVGTLGGTARAQLSGLPRESGAVLSVVRTEANQGVEYQVIDGNGDELFRTRGGANEAFQRAFDELSEGGTVIASDDTFQFNSAATMGDNTHLTGQGSTRFVVTQTGTGNDPVPAPSQTNPLPTGHDLIRVRGDNTSIRHITFDGAGTQLNNQAVQADDCTGVIIAGNRTVNGFQFALSVTRSEDVLITGNEVLNPNWYGITTRGAPAGSDIDLRQSTDVTIARNRVSGMKFNNIAPYNVSNFLVTENIVFDGGHSLIACSPAQQGAIVGNVCRGLNTFAPDPGGEAGIEIEYKETHLREGATGTKRARSYDITITGNQVDNCPVGILARTVPADAEDQQARETDRPYSFTITGNTVSNAANAGIRIRSGADGVVATNTVRGVDTAIDIAEEFTTTIQQDLNVTRE